MLGQIGLKLPYVRSLSCVSFIFQPGSFDFNSSISLCVSFVSIVLFFMDRDQSPSLMVAFSRKKVVSRIPFISPLIKS